MSAQEHLSPAQFPQHIAALKAAHFAQRETGEPNSMGRTHPPRPDTLYHGTNAALSPGALITPGRESNWDGITKDVDAKHVFATGDITEGYHFGMHAAHNEEQSMSARDMYQGAIPAAHIYEVHPTGRLAPDAEMRGEYFDEGSSPSYQSRQPLRVGREVSRGAKAEWHASIGSEWEPHSGVCRFFEPDRIWE